MIVHMRNLIKLYISSRKSEEKAKIKYNPELAMQYLKWLKYIPEKELEEMKKILNKKISELTKDEIHKIHFFNKCQNVIPILERYLGDECQNRDILSVYDFMKNTSLYDLMLSKLTKEELNIAQLKIEQLNCLSDSELSKLIKEKMTFKVYMELSMIDAFCINRILSLLKARTNEKSDIEISAHINSKRKGFLL